MEYALRLAQYEGPLTKLLALIEERQLDVNEISLATVTDDFLRYLEKLPTVAPALLADFLLVASRLVLIKSRSLLPELPLTAEEEEDIRDLERRLELYRRFKDAEKHVHALWRSGHRSASRPYLLHASYLPPVFHPGRNLDVDALVAAFGQLYAALEKFSMETTTIQEVVVSLEEKIREIAERMEGLREISLHKLSATRARSEIVAIFLAVLHLAREGRVALAQAGRFSDIIVSKTDGLAERIRSE
jgi:segregation and condensation protein A